MNVVGLIDNASGPINAPAVREKIFKLEDALKEFPQLDLPVTHRYSGGIYARELFIPKDTIITGAIYRDDHFDVMISGDITVTSEDGAKRLKGFNIFSGHKGKKRAGFAHEDTRWITFCVSPEVPDDEYFDLLTTNSFEEIESPIWINEGQIIDAFKARQSYKMDDLICSSKAI